MESTRMLVDCCNQEADVQHVPLTPAELEHRKSVAESTAQFFNERAARSEQDAQMRQLAQDHADPLVKLLAQRAGLA